MVNESKLPPVSELCITTMVLVVIGGIYMAGHIPNDVPTLLPTVLTVAAVIVLAIKSSRSVKPRRDEMMRAIIEAPLET